jgi:hypothetical protein
MTLIDILSLKFTHTRSFIIVAIGLTFVAWLAYLIFLRKSKFGFVLWFPFTAISALGSLLFVAFVVGLLAASLRAGQDMEAGFAQIGFALATAFFFLWPVVLTISIIYRPAFDDCRPTIVVPTILLVVFAIPLPFIYEQKADSLAVNITLLNSDHGPLANATVSRTEPPNKYSYIRTDERGKAQLIVNLNDTISGGFSMDGYQTIAYVLITPLSASTPLKASFYVTPQKTVPYGITHQNFPLTDDHDVNITYTLYRK